MDIPTIPGALYTVATKTTCDITDTATGTPIDSVSSGSVTFAAQGSVTTLSDSAATYTRVNFKNAAAALRMLGGGDQLPSGYLAALFTRRTAHQILWTGLTANSDTEIEIDYSPPPPFDGSVWVFSNADEERTETNKSFAFSRHCSAAGLANWYQFGASSGTTRIVVPNAGREIVKMRKGFLQIGTQSQTISTASFVGTTDLAIFGNVRDTNARVLTVYGCKLHQAGELVREFAPCLDSAGRSGLWDKVEKKMYHSANGEFAIGMTLTQARGLGKLPAGGGSLKIVLPENYTDDEAVVAALSTGTGKGWVFEIQTYTTDEVSASTFSLRRIWVRKTADAAGAYVAATGERWHVEWCQTVLGAEPTDLGYELFRSVDVALAEWELTPYIYHEEELSSI